MNKRQKEVELAKLEAEKIVLEQLKQVYQKAANDCARKIRLHSGRINALLKDWDDLDDKQKSILQSQIYQRKYQESLKQQIDGFLETLNSSQQETIEAYFEECYQNGYIGCVYDMHGQMIPLIMPINQKQMLKALKLDPKVSRKLYGKYVNQLKKRIRQEISRGISTGLTFGNMAKNLNRAANTGFNNAMRIVRTEGHRVQVESANDAQHDAKAKGADIVKQWDAALDDRTRESHRQVDGEIRELDEPFSNGLMYPSDPSGGAEEVVNCRCALLQRASWALDESELETLKERAAYFGLDKSKNFEDFQKKYLKAAD